MEKRTDWLGREYGPGDIVLWARANSMGLGEVYRFTEAGNVTVYPIATAGKKRTRTIYIDRRNGARIPQKWGYVNSEGDFLSWQQYRDKGYPDEYSGGFKPVKDGIAIEVLDYPVTIYKSQHVIKWEGSVPDGEAEQVN